MMKKENQISFPKFLIGILFAGLLLSGCTQGALAKDDGIQGVERIIAIGDLHGDYEAYVEIMKAAGLRDDKGKWIGGKTHLVQTGDVTDRGPDSKKIYDDLFKLSKRAKKAGGEIHLLMGNHEMMNMLGDLRYVHPGEYEAFASRDSKRHLKAFFDSLVARGIFQDQIEGQGKTEGEVYEEWLKTHPEGFVEHRIAWGVGGEYYKKILEMPALLKINDTLFLHAGIGPDYANVTVDEFNATVKTAIETNDQAAFDLLFSDGSPLWYRGLAQNGEEELPHLNAVLENYEVNRIVVGHTPTGGVVLPRFDGKVIVNDVGLAEYYGSGRGFTKFEDGVWSGVHWCTPAPLPDAGDENLIAYLKGVADLSPNPGRINQLINDLENPPAEEPAG